MLKPFFHAAMVSPGRQLAFRRLAVTHVLLLVGLSWSVLASPTPSTRTTFGYLVLVLGIVEGAALVGWRLTQLPKSQALEFLLTSPVQPRRVFVAEGLVGVGRFALVWLGGLPILGLLFFVGAVDVGGLTALAVMPFVWGVFAGLALTAWVYEPVVVRRLGELLGLLGVLVYLVVGVVAGENLRAWLHGLPEWLGRFLFDAVVFLHEMNPFGVMRYWFLSDRADTLAWERFEYLHLFAGTAILAAGLRGACRLKGHFHDRHYGGRVVYETGRMHSSDGLFSFTLFPFTFADQPLSWWAVRRVMEYSGRSNLWLGGGFALLYAAYLAAGDHWPAWMGRIVFQIFESWGGAPAVATALVVMAAVPAAFQYGLWDSTVPDRCRRLELLLLTQLTGRDYWFASLAAAWRRGRGYFVGPVALWLALGVSGRNEWLEVVAAAVGGVALWGFSFAVGFRAFATGMQTNGLATILTLGLPVLVFVLLRLKLDLLASFIPTALSYLPVRSGSGVTGSWAASLVLTVGTTAALTYLGLSRCDADLRRWYDANQGTKASL